MEKNANPLRRLHPHYFFTAFGFIVLGFALWRATIPVQTIARAETEACALSNARIAVSIYYSERRADLVRQRDLVMERGLPPQWSKVADKLSLEIRQTDSDRATWFADHTPTSACDLSPASSSP